MTSPHWEQRGDCRAVEPDLFFPEGPLSNELISQMELARSICASCPVRQQCLDAELLAEQGMSAEDRSGIRGGLDGRERYALSRGSRPPKRPQPIPDDGREHGIRRTYRKGCRCFACTAAETSKSAAPQGPPARERSVELLSAQYSRVNSGARPTAAHIRPGAAVMAKPGCGTRSGYRWHVGRAEVPCGACVEADMAVAWFLRTGMG
ncbi:WhiB family transcriptional regulator [Streptomyces sp. CAU 1734]|uniref:WhiB family transcriptional regulator n=1 Tax=Streptomyces sp. CAU 1734 TaxID=3140360 RepID=UPI0032601C2A